MATVSSGTWNGGGGLSPTLSLCYSEHTEVGVCVPCVNVCVCACIATNEKLLSATYMCACGEYPPGLLWPLVSR